MGKIFGNRYYTFKNIIKNIFVKRDKLNFIVDMFLNDMSRSFSHNTLKGEWKENAKDIEQEIKENYSFLNTNLNIYRALVIHYRKVNIKEPEAYKELFRLSQNALDNIIENEVKECEPRLPNPIESKSLVLWDTKKLHNEMEKSVKWLRSKIDKQKDPIIKQKWDGVLSDLFSFVRTSVELIEGSIVDSKNKDLNEFDYDNSKYDKNKINEEY